MIFKPTSISTAILLLMVVFQAEAGQNQHTNKRSELGKQLFFDTNLSNPPGQSCASCHDPKHGFIDSTVSTPTSEGVTAGRFGSRNTPTAMYMAFSPKFHYDEEEELYIGGQFLDGRAATLEEQAQMPFLNHLEMANTNKQMVVDKVRSANYSKLFKRVFGKHGFDNTEQAYSNIANAIAAFERTEKFNRFTSKYDYYLAGKARFTEQEEHGLALFEREDKGNCAACHPSQSGPEGESPLFTDFSYDNLGVPRNPDNFFYAMSVEYNVEGEAFVDVGLAANPVVKATGQTEQEKGKIKVPTLRNVAITGPWMHNGYFQTLQGVVEFYNTRDVRNVCAEANITQALAQSKDCWPMAEVAENVNDSELGNLNLTEDEVQDIVAFLKTLTDGYHPLKNK
ncbi:cytochrome-c peroxidase [Methyloprofundus sedimenti]|uniref:Cytochrome-c peroxidase n=1 Tax=Methyloprofundus sedimenti TaxID=1420851 RepID=A0A1V8M9F1_9GAMM|nr:cytochrome c peroxidase [Methyloprofundus sedimenti]OQK18148.1 cytochrome-c peroxidase [Methyloprofundus sedimenti]